MSLYWDCFRFTAGAAPCWCRTLPVLHGAEFRSRRNPRSEPAKSPSTGGLGWPVYSPKNELSIIPGRGSAPPDPGPAAGESSLVD
jgi:hypothetical protein